MYVCHKLVLLLSNYMGGSHSTNSAVNNAPATSQGNSDSPVAVISVNNNTSQTVITQNIISSPALATFNLITPNHALDMKGDGRVKLDDMDEIMEGLCCNVCEELLEEPRVSFLSFDSYSYNFFLLFFFSYDLNSVIFKDHKLWPHCMFNVYYKPSGCQ